MPDGAAEVSVAMPGAITVDGIPPIPAALAESLRPYGETRSATALSWNPADRSLLIATRFASTLQLHQVASPMGARRQLTFEPERIVDARWAACVRVRPRRVPVRRTTPGSFHPRGGGLPNPRGLPSRQL